MKTMPTTCNPRSKGSTLVVTLLFILLMTMTIGSLMTFTGSEAAMLARRTSRVDANYGAESAVRRSMAQIRQLYLENYSTNSYLSGNLAAPTDTELTQLTSVKAPSTVSHLNNGFSFTNFSVQFTTGTATNRYIQYSIPTTDESLTSYAGLTSQRATIQCSAQAASKTAGTPVARQISQTFNIDYIPVFQYAIFYNMDMECFNGPTMTVNGKVHANGTLYYAPADTLTINANLTASEDIERGIKVWDSGKPKLLSAQTAAIKAYYGNSQAAYAADPANWVSLDPTSSGYGEASFKVKNSTTGSLVDFRTSTSPLAFYDSESTGWAGGALTKWGGGVKSKDQGIDDVPPPIPTDVIASASDPNNPYHVMIEAPVLDANGASTESASAQSAKMAYTSSVIIKRSDSATVTFHIKGSDGNYHQVNNLRNATNIVKTATTTVRDQREYVQNGNVRMSVTEFDVSAFYGAAGASNVGATDSNGNWKDSTGTTITTDAAGNSFTPVPFNGTVYIYDEDFSSTYKPGIRIKNASTIYDKDSNPSGHNGISIITQNPVYVQGNFNADGSLTTAPQLTGASKENIPPAMIAGDVLSVLSKGWDNSAHDNPASSDYFSRNESQSTEINAAILAGVNRSSQDVVVNSFDGTTGGVNNFLRFLENWTEDGSTFKYSGSMVSLWYGAQSTSTYRGAGTANDVFSAPTRDWAFNTDFLDPNKLPRGTPIIRVYTTANWSNF